MCSYFLFVPISFIQEGGGIFGKNKTAVFRIETHLVLLQWRSEIEQLSVCLRFSTDPCTEQGVELDDLEGTFQLCDSMILPIQTHKDS